MEMLLGWTHTSLRSFLPQAHQKDGTKGVMMALRNHTGMGEEVVPPVLSPGTLNWGAAPTCEELEIRKGL